MTLAHSGRQLVTQSGPHAVTRRRVECYCHLALRVGQGMPAATLGRWSGAHGNLFILEAAMRSLIFCLFAAAWLTAVVAPASGAEIRDATPEELLRVGTSIILEGKIEAGDYDKLLKLIDVNCGYEFKGMPACADGIYLASPGGDVIEAMKIGRLVRKLRLETRVPSDLPPRYRQKAEAILKDPKSNFMCASACFFVFVAGINREGGEGGIYPPILGIHRPYFSDVELKRLSGNQVIASSGQMRTLVRDYLKEMGVLAKYADLMSSTPKEQVRFLNDEDFESDFEGYIPELRDWLEAKCNSLTDIEKSVEKVIEGKKRHREVLTESEERMNRMLSEKHIQQGECHAKVLSKLREDAWRQFHGH